MLVTVSCSTTRIFSNSSIPVVFEKVADHTQDISIEVERDFYLWGLIPSTHEIGVDKEFSEKGIDSVANFSIKERFEKTNFVWAIATFGFYMPKSYVLTGKTY